MHATNTLGVLATRRTARVPFCTVIWRLVHAVALFFSCWCRTSRLGDGEAYRHLLKQAREQATKQAGEQAGRHWAMDATTGRSTRIAGATSTAAAAPSRWAPECAFPRGNCL
jgi:hypothetical protein